MMHVRALEFPIRAPDAAVPTPVPARERKSRARHPQLERGIFELAEFAFPGYPKHIFFVSTSRNRQCVWEVSMLEWQARRTQVLAEMYRALLTIDPASGEMPLGDDVILDERTRERLRRAMSSFLGRKKLFKYDRLQELLFIVEQWRESPAKIRTVDTLISALQRGEFITFDYWAASA